MRKIIVLLATWMLIFSLSCTAFAAQDGITLADGTGQPGKTVYLTVKLNEALVGNSIGLSYSFDPAVLEAVPASCSWSRQGVLQDFDEHNQGVWATDKAVDLQGTICVLAFHIRDNIRLTSTKVSCKVSVMNGPTEVGNYEAEATISQGCDHEYGDWADAGAIGHNRKCGLCGSQQTQSHTMDGGVVQTNPNSATTDWKVFTCTVCGAREVYDIPKTEQEQPEATKPTETMPTLPTAPTEPQPEQGNHNTAPTYPNQGNGQQNGSQNGDLDGDSHEDHNHDLPFRDYNQPQETTDEEGNRIIISGDGYVHMEGEEELPLIIQSNDSGESHDHEHDHAEDVQVLTKAQQGGNFLLVIGVLAAMFAAGAWYLKKKK